ncbi:MAG: DUF1559 domain-containing protein [Planctomycetaceae bacterium]|nr:DUF1559 domain-containing protein [Planctomycetaceae bacterium]
MSMCVPLRHERTGFSLIELLVVLAILSILVALILPAVQQARGAARRTQCLSNLKQLGVALHNYHDVHDGFPPGYTAPEVASDGISWEFTESSFAWGAHLLPYLEQSSLYDKLQIYHPLEHFLETSAEPQLAQTQLAVFRCVDDLAGETLSSAPLAPNYRDLDRDWPDPTEKGFGGGSSSYVGSCGYFPPHEPYGPVAGTYFPDYDRKTGPNNGLFYTGSHVSIGDITDGSSHTIAIGERAWFQGSATWIGTSDVLGPDPGGASVCLGRCYWRINELPDPPGVFMTSANKQVIPPFSNFTARDGFSSYHPGGAHFLFADGSVRFLSENIDSRVTTPPRGVDVGPVPDANLLGVFQLLGIRDDSQAVGEF